MNTHYTTDRSTQMVLSVLKAYGIKKIVVSPGTTNMAFVASAQSDPCFEMYSSVDERSAAYIACGLSQESGEAVVISCTGATASRDYMPGLDRSILSETARTGHNRLAWRVSNWAPSSAGDRQKRYSQRHCSLQCQYQRNKMSG